MNWLKEDTHKIVLAVVIVISMVTLIGVHKYKIFVANQNEKERLANELVESQNRVIEETQKEIDNLKKQNVEIEKNQQSLVSSVSRSSQPDISAIIKKWHPIVGFIYCNFQYTNGVTYSEQTGSGAMILYPDGTRAVLTNMHVVTDEEGYGPAECLIKFPKSSTIYSAYDVMPLKQSVDAAYLFISNPDTYLRNMTSEGRGYCNHIPELGDKILILGYPSIGSPQDITVTDGIISGIDGLHYITSAKVEYGNSGGIAIDVKNDCYLGIPTYARAGRIESLARILKWQAF